MYARILVALDGSAAARALDAAIRLATALHAQLRLLHVVDNAPLWRGAELPLDPEGIDEAWAAVGRRVLAAGEAAARAAGLPVAAVSRETDGSRVSETIATEATAWPADLIVLGTHGRLALAQLALGRVAEEVVRRVAGPVLLVRGPVPAA